MRLTLYISPFQMAPTKTKKKPGTPHSARNYVLGGSGVMRFSASRMYKKRGVYK